MRTIADSRPAEEAVFQDEEIAVRTYLESVSKLLLYKLIDWLVRTMSCKRYSNGKVIPNPRIKSTHRETANVRLSVSPWRPIH